MDELLTKVKTKCSKTKTKTTLPITVTDTMHLSSYPKSLGNLLPLPTPQPLFSLLNTLHQQCIFPRFYCEIVCFLSHQLPYWFCDNRDNACLHYYLACHNSRKLGIYNFFKTQASLPTQHSIAHRQSIHLEYTLSHLALLHSLIALLALLFQRQPRFAQLLSQLHRSKARATHQ
jgi:hypothetical protein